MFSFHFMNIQVSDLDASNVHVSRKSIIDSQVSIYNHTLVVKKKMESIENKRKTYRYID